MHYDSEIFRKQFPLVKYFVWHLVYYRELGDAYRNSGLKSEFWTLTIDAHVMQAITYWCMVFGTDSNQTHWKNLSSNEELSASFRSHLFAHTDLNDSTWDGYWNGMVNFRNQYAAHRSLHFTPPVPFLDCALEVAYAYDQWVRAVIFPDTFDEPPLNDSAVELQRVIKPVIHELLQVTNRG